MPGYKNQFLGQVGHGQDQDHLVFLTKQSLKIHDKNGNLNKFPFNFEKLSFMNHPHFFGSEDETNGSVHHFRCCEFLLRRAVGRSENPRGKVKVNIFLRRSSEYDEISKHYFTLLTKY